MTVSVRRDATREILVVLGLAVGGLLLAVLAAFTPWYGLAAESAEVEVVELHSPPGVVAGDGGVTTASEG